MTRVIWIIAVLFILMGINVSVPADEDVFPEKKEKNFSLEFSELEAKSAVVLDLRSNKMIFEKNPDLEWPLASLAKLSAAAVFYENAPSVAKEGTLGIPITREALLQEGDDGFLIGESYDANDLLKIMLVKSSNDAAHTLSMWLENYMDEKKSSWFINEMNSMAASAGLQKTYFLNATGLDIDENLSGAYGSARETAVLFSFLLKNFPEVMSVSSRPSLAVHSLQGRVAVFNSTAGPIMGMPGLIAVKTGYTDLAGGNLVFAFSPSVGKEYAVAILGSSFGGRFEDALKIHKAVLEYING